MKNKVSFTLVSMVSSQQNEKIQILIRITIKLEKYNKR